MKVSICNYVYSRGYCGGFIEEEVTDLSLEDFVYEYMTRDVREENKMSREDLDQDLEKGTFFDKEGQESIGLFFEEQTVIFVKR